MYEPLLPISEDPEEHMETGALDPQEGDPVRHPAVFAAGAATALLIAVSQWRADTESLPDGRPIWMMIFGVCHAVSERLASRGVYKNLGQWFLPAVLAVQVPCIYLFDWMYIAAGCRLNSNHLICAETALFDHFFWSGYAALTWFIWGLCAVALCWVVDVNNRWFWRAKDAAWWCMQFLRWAFPAVYVVGPAGIVCVALAGAVWVLYMTVRHGSRLDARDGWLLVVIIGMLLVRLSQGYHIHHAEWPLYVAVLARRAPWLAGVFVGIAWQEITGNEGFRI